MARRWLIVGLAAQVSCKRDRKVIQTGWMALTIFGVVVLTFMMLMYALERKGPRFILAFALGCGLSSTYGFLSGAWPFGCVEAIWTVIAIHRYWGTTHGETAN
jgi:hypothetical protein